MGVIQLSIVGGVEAPKLITKRASTMLRGPTGVLRCTVTTVGTVRLAERGLGMSAVRDQYCRSSGGGSVN